jgi:hypothetical protein
MSGDGSEGIWVMFVHGISLPMPEDWAVVVLPPKPVQPPK